MMKYAGLLLLSLTASSHAASFDCSKASSVSEKLICQTPSLSAADERLATDYRQARTASGNSPEFRQLTKQNWQRREQCQTTACLSDWYRRSQQLYRQIAAPQANSQIATPQPNIQAAAPKPNGQNTTPLPTRCLSEGSPLTTRAAPPTRAAYPPKRASTSSACRGSRAAARRLSGGYGTMQNTWSIRLRCSGGTWRITKGETISGFARTPVDHGPRLATRK